MATAWWMAKRTLKEISSRERCRVQRKGMWGVREGKRVAARQPGPELLGFGSEAGGLGKV